MIDISIIIITYNSEKYIQCCIDSIINKTEKLKYEIIIFDNNSQDNTVEIINSIINKYPDIKFIKNDSNIGFGKAVNIVSEYTKGKYLFFLNPDTYFINNALDILYEKALENPSYPVLGGKLYDENNKYMFSCGFLPNVKEIILLLSNNIKYIKKRIININQIQEIELISGCDFFINKKIFNLVGKFDEDYFLYNEELDLCFRLKKMGYKLLFIPDAKIRHLNSQKKKNNYTIKSYQYKYSYLYCRKNFKIDNLLLIRLIFSILAFLVGNNIKNHKNLIDNILFIWKN